jgi:hypothetical protein
VKWAYESDLQSLAISGHYSIEWYKSTNRFIAYCFAVEPRVLGGFDSWGEAVSAIKKDRVR